MLCKFVFLSDLETYLYDNIVIIIEQNNKIDKKAKCHNSSRPNQ